MSKARPEGVFVYLVEETDGVREWTCERFEGKQRASGSGGSFLSYEAQFPILAQFRHRLALTTWDQATWWSVLLVPAKLSANRCGRGRISLVWDPLCGYFAN